MGSMGIRGYKAGRTWSRLLVIALTFLISTPMASGQFDGEADRAADDRPAAPNPIPILSLCLYPSQLQAVVTQSQIGTVTFGGNATVDQLFFQDSTVTLQAVVNTGWPVKVDPTTIFFKGPGTERFQVTVIIPPGTSSLVVGNVIATGSCKAPGLSPTVATAQGIVTVKQYHKIRIESEEPQERVSSGDTAEFEIFIYNDGNGPATFKLTVLDMPKDIKVELNNDEYSLQEDQFARVFVKVTPGGRAPAGEHVIGIRVEAFNGQGDDGDSTTFNVTAVVPSMASEIGYPTIAGLVIVAGVAVAMIVLSKKGKLKGLKMPKRSNAEG